MPVPSEIRGRFARAGGAVKIGGKAARRLIGSQRAAVLLLADGDVGSGQIQQQRGTRQRGLRRRRNRRPEIFADFHEETQLRLVLRPE